MLNVKKKRVMETILTIVSCTIIIVIGILLGILLRGAWEHIDLTNEDLRKSREESIKNIKRLEKDYKSKFLI